VNDKVKGFPIKHVPLVNEDVVNVLEMWLDQARRGELVSVGLVGTRVGGEWQSAFSSSDNGPADAGMLLELAVRRLGFSLKVAK
jgi:hypothetical protein